MFANQYLTLKRTYKIVMWDLVTRDYSKTVSYTHLDVYKRQVINSFISCHSNRYLAFPGFPFIGEHRTPTDIKMCIRDSFGTMPIA